MENRVIAGIKRRKEFSPNHVDNDAAIFALCADALREKGFQVNVYEEEEFLTDYAGERLIFHMARHQTTLRKLNALEQTGRRVINSIESIDHCGREHMTRLFAENQIPQPRSVILSTDLPVPSSIPFPKLWLKRCDAHTQSADDVCFVEEEDFHRKLAGFAQREIPRVVINEHLEGDLVKFYGVTGTSFFYWFYPNHHQHSKFGQEVINGIPREIPFSVSQLKEVCHNAAQLLQLDIWGGDAIISPDGTFRLIDFNDFPSFAPCRNEAAPAIADRIFCFVDK